MNHRKGQPKGHSGQTSRVLSPEPEVKRKDTLFPHAVVFFVVMWLFATFWYDDVFVMARDYSFFAFDRILMLPVWERPYGSLWIVGRALLCLFAYPWLGGLAFAAILTLISWLTGCLLRLPARWLWAQYIPAAVYMAVLVWAGFDAFVFRDPGCILGIPFCVLVILAIQVAFLRTFSHRSLTMFWRNRSDETRLTVGTTLMMVLLIPVASVFYGSVYRSDVRVTARLQRLMWQQRWAEMVTTAQTWDGSCRPVAAYHAIGLAYTGRLLTDLFKIKYDYTPLHLVSRSGKPSLGGELYEVDCNFHAGLLQSAYRNDMEQTMLDGVATVRLHRMIRFAVMKGERNLALRYLHVLGKQPFESGFIAKYKPMAENSALVDQDPELRAIRQLEPVDNIFEGAFQRPLFIGYNVSLKQGRSQVALDISTAACLYAKMMPPFLYRVQFYANQGTWPPLVGEALGMMSVKEPQSVNYGGLDLYKQRFTGFVRDVRGKQKDDQAIDEAFENYRGYYPYYYYFGNRNAPHKATPADEQQHEKGGVN